MNLDVVVLDDKRQPVRGLTAGDFTVFDEGVARPIRAFSPVELPPRTRSSEAAWAHTVPPDVVSNQVGEQEGRLVIILMDRSIPVQQPTVVARRVAAAAIEELGPDHSWTLRTGKDLSIALRRSGDYERALELALDLHARYVRLFDLESLEVLRGLRQDAANVNAPLLQPADQVERFIGRDAATDDQGDAGLGEGAGALRRRGGRGVGASGRHSG